ncbi:hypothetical protein SFUMM280S_06798 [Streptomyces fumanus]
MHDRHAGETVKEHKLWKHTLFLVGPALDAHGTRSHLYHPGHFHGFRKADPDGVGASRNAPAEEILALVEGALREAGLSPASLAELATVDAKAEEPGIVAAAERLGVPLVTYPAGELARVEVPNPSEAPLAAVGTPSVAEAAALLRGGDLLVPKRKSAMATCAVVRRPGRGRLAVVGLGPGARDLLTPAPARGCTAPRCWSAWTSTSTRSAICCARAPGCWSRGSAPRRSGPAPRSHRPGWGTPSR